MKVFLQQSALIMSNFPLIDVMMKVFLQQSALIMSNFPLIGRNNESNSGRNDESISASVSFNHV